ncbi:hypothetical protein E4O93_14760 [Diaphorobacter sp. DS2]|nr:hypothetical protein E4O93_14760 [Diaphorobacter sp. DS2]
MTTPITTNRSTLDQRLAFLARRDQTPLEINAAGEARGFVQLALQEIEREVALLAAEAQQTSTDFWIAVREGRAELPKDQRTYIGTRVRLVNGSLSIEWYRNAVSINSTGGVKNVISRRIKKGTSYTYPKTAFEKEPQWVREVIDAAEKRYACIRERAAILTQIKRELRKYEKLIED